MRLSLQDLRRGLGEIEELMSTVFPESQMGFVDGSRIEYVDVLRQAIEALRFAGPMADKVERLRNVYGVLEAALHDLDPEGKGSL